MKSDLTDHLIFLFAHAFCAGVCLTIILVSFSLEESYWTQVFFTILFILNSFCGIVRIYGISKTYKQITQC